MAQFGPLTQLSEEEALVPGQKSVVQFVKIGRICGGASNMQLATIARFLLR